MAFDFGSVGDVSSWAQGMSTPVRPVTDLSPHVDGGPATSSSGTNATSDAGSKMVLYDAAAIVILAVVFLWFTGSLALRTHNL